MSALVTFESALAAYKARFAGLASVTCEWCGRVVAIAKKRGTPRRHGCPTPAWDREGRIAWYSDKPTERTPCRVRQSGDGAVLSRWTDEFTARRHARLSGGYVERFAPPAGVP